MKKPSGSFSNDRSAWNYFRIESSFLIQPYFFRISYMRIWRKAFGEGLRCEDPAPESGLLRRLRVGVACAGGRTTYPTTITTLVMFFFPNWDSFFDLIDYVTAS